MAYIIRYVVIYALIFAVAAPIIITVLKEGL